MQAGEALHIAVMMCGLLALKDSDAAPTQAADPESD